MHPLLGLSILVIILESSQLRSHQEDIHERSKSCSHKTMIWPCFVPPVILCIFNLICSCIVYLQPSSSEEGAHCSRKMLDQWGIVTEFFFMGDTCGWNIKIRYYSGIHSGGRMRSLFQNWDQFSLSGCLCCQRWFNYSQFCYPFLRIVHLSPILKWLSSATLNMPF